MDTYDIGRLTDFDFEAVCKDLLQAHFNIRLELFAPGRDQGVDLRHLSAATGSSLIVQCKHWDKSASSALIRHMKKEELPKVARLRPARYILATSASLSKAAKDELATTLYPYTPSPSDILGLHEIEALLREHPEVVQRHLRLWLSSTGILQAVLNRSAMARSADLAQDIDEATRLYVPNDSYRRAHQILERQHYCIIAGLPGIGKTMLAKVLSASFADAGYELIEISEDAEEINKAWVDDVPQLFYYDDFLGQTTLSDKLHKNEDNRLLRVLKRAASNPNKRIILTTREYILETAKQHYERIASSDFNLSTCVINLNDYTQLIRAEILYNHVYYSDLPDDAKEEFANPQTFLPIIRHRNFNPRLIERSLHKSAVDGELGTETARSLISNMDHPARLWAHIVENQLDATSINILVVLFSLDGSTHLSDLEKALHNYSHNRIESVLLKRKLKILESTMIRVLGPPRQGNLRHSGPRIAYHNPSIRDYMRDYVSDNPDFVQRLIETAAYFEQLASIWTVAKGWGGADLLSILRLNAEIFEESAIRAYEEPPTLAHGYYSSYPHERLEVDKIKRLRHLVDFCAELGSERIVSFTSKAISECNFYEEATDGTALAAVVKTIYTSPYQKISQHGERLLNEAIEWATCDLYSWDNINYAKQTLNELGDMVSEEVMQEIEDAFDREAISWMETFEELGDPKSGDPDTIREIIQRAERISGETDITSKARLALHKIEERLGQQRVVSPKTEPAVPEEDINERIHQMLACLRRQ